MIDFINSLSSTANIDISIKLSLALLFGALIGLERIFAHKPAGMRTYALVSMGSALFVIISEIISVRYLSAGINPDPLKMAANILVGIGFLGAGMIIFKDSALKGLTTAAGLWVSAGIGMAVGYGLYQIGFLAVIFTLFIYTVLFYIERWLLMLHDGTGHEDR